MKKFLFVTYGGGHVKMVVAVAKQLMARPDVEVNILGLTTARKVVENAGIPCFSCRDLDISPKAAEYGATLLASLGGGHPDVPDEESLAYMGLSYKCLVAEHGEAKAVNASLMCPVFARNFDRWGPGKFRLATALPPPYHRLTTALPPPCHRHCHLSTAILAFPPSLPDKRESMQPGNR